VDTEGVIRRGAGQATPFPYPGQEVPDHAADGDPGARYVGIEHVGLGRQLDRLLEHDHGSPDVDIAPVETIAIQRPRTPNKHPFADECADCVDGLALSGDVQILLLIVRNADRRRHYGIETYVGRRLPHATGIIDHGVYPGHSRRRGKKV